MLKTQDNQKHGKKQGRRTMALIVIVCFCVLLVRPCLDWALIGCVARGQTSNVKHLLALGADADTRCADPEYAIIQAAALNYPAALQLLLDDGGNPNAHLQSGETALILAAEHGNSEVVDVLLRAGANPNLDDGDGTPPIEYARAYPKIVAALKKHGVRA